MIKSSASIYLVLPSAISFIFSSTLLSTASATALSVDFYPSLPVFLLRLCSYKLWLFCHSRSSYFSLSGRLLYSGPLWYRGCTLLFGTLPDFDPKDAISASLSYVFTSKIYAAYHLVPVVLFLETGKQGIIYGPAHSSRG